MKFFLGSLKIKTANMFSEMSQKKIYIIMTFFLDSTIVAKVLFLIICSPDIKSA